MDSETMTAPGMSNLASKLDQIGPKWDKNLGHFKISLSTFWLSEIVLQSNEKTHKYTHNIVIVIHCSCKLFVD